MQRGQWLHNRAPIKFTAILKADLQKGSTPKEYQIRIPYLKNPSNS